MLIRSAILLLTSSSTTISFTSIIQNVNIKSSTLLFNNPEIGAGGMADTRNPNAYIDSDPRKSISAAPSFEEYMKMRQAGEQQQTGGSVQSTPTPVPVVSTPVVAGGGDAIAKLDASQLASIQKIASEIPDIASKPDFTWTSADGITVKGCTTTLDARDAPGPSNVGWLAGVCVASKLSSLTLFNGPLTDIPHIVSRCYVIDNTLRFKLDFRPRCYGAYEMIRPDGSYPGPDELGRVSFEYSSARNQFETKFGNDEMKLFLSNTMSSFTDATTYDPNPSELDLLTRGPLFTSLTMPNTDANVDAIVKARERIVDFWLGWVKDSQHGHRPGAPVNTQYVYDTKFKQNAYGALLQEYAAVYGQDDGKKLAVGESGPLDEAYVGGGS